MERFVDVTSACINLNTTGDMISHLHTLIPLSIVTASKFYTSCVLLANKKVASTKLLLLRFVFVIFVYF